MIRSGEDYCCASIQTVHVRPPADEAFDRGNRTMEGSFRRYLRLGDFRWVPSHGMRPPKKHTGSAWVGGGWNNDCSTAQYYTGPFLGVFAMMFRGRQGKTTPVSRASRGGRHDGVRAVTEPGADQLVMRNAGCGTAGWLDGWLYLYGLPILVMCCGGGSTVSDVRDGWA